jgi:hypothetical protein
MAHQMLYTSAPTGLENRAGFQFVAASPAASPAVRQAVAPYLTYRPPPSAPARPSGAELARFPVSYCFERTEAGMALVRCRYLGADYSGRYGNFLAHAVLATADELSGLYPIELWRSPIWADRAEPAVLPELTDLVPGKGNEPEAVLDRLGAGGERALRVLADLVDATVASVEGTGSQIVLVAERVDIVAGWIAAISYSLPLALALDLSFVTYTADPDRARQRLVGTTPDCWAGGVSEAQAFDLDAPAPAATRPGRYAQAVAAAWRARDLTGVDALRDLISMVDPASVGDREAAMVLAALSRGEQVREAEAAAAADLIRRYAERLPDSLLSGLAEQPGDRLGFPVVRAAHDAALRLGRGDLARRMGAAWLAFALRDPRHRASLPSVEPLPPAQRQVLAPTVTQALGGAADLGNVTGIVALAHRFELPVDLTRLRTAVARAVRTPGDIEAAHRAMPSGELRAALLDGVVAGLEGADRRFVGTALTPAVCDLLVDRDWSPTPAVGCYVLVSHGRRHPARRIGMTEALTSLADRGRVSAAHVDRCVGEVWKLHPPTIADCLRLIGTGGVLSDVGMRRSGVLDLTRKAFATADPRSPETVRLAERVHELVDERAHPAAADAAVVLAVREMTPRALSVGCVRLDRARADAAPGVVKEATRRACDVFVRTTPEGQAVVLVALPPGSLLAADLVHALLRAGVGDLDLVELAAWLRRQRRPNEAITARALKATRQQFRAAELRIALGKRNRALVKPFDELVHRGSRPGFFGRIIRRDDRA